MTTGTFSFTFDHAAARQAFPSVPPKNLVLALLAGIPVEGSWEGCLVYLGPSPSDRATTTCVGTRGPGADEVQEKLVEAMESRGIPVLAVYEGGPQVQEDIALAQARQWGAARPPSSA